jgi:stage 0 sporulation protein B (sporulation initiation phosphotransferase)
MSDEQKLFTQQTDQLLKVLNQQRHDWLNHFQVLLGYLRLGRPEQGEEYLKRVTELAYQDSMIARINSSLLSVFFLTFNALHTDLLLDVEVCNQVNLKEASVPETDLFRVVTDVVFAVKDHVNKPEYEPASMLVSVLADESGIHFRFDLAGGLRASGRRELEKLVVSSKQLGIDVAEWIDTDEEWVLEIVVPVVEGKR